MSIWVFPNIVVPQNGWFIVETPIKIDDMGGTPIFGNTHKGFVQIFVIGSVHLGFYVDCFCRHFWVFKQAGLMLFEYPWLHLPLIALEQRPGVLISAVGGFVEKKVTKNSECLEMTWQNYWQQCSSIFLGRNTISKRPMFLMAKLVLFKSYCCKTSRPCLRFLTCDRCLYKRLQEWCVMCVCVWMGNNGNNSRSQY